MGSNSIRMVVFDTKGPWPKVLLNEKITASLGKGLEATGQLAPQTKALALEGLSRFGVLLRSLSVTDMTAIATAAVRDASDGKAFLGQATDILGFPIAIAKGNQEALLGLKGIAAGIQQAEGLFADMGGGSMQMGHIGQTYWSHNQEPPRKSFPLGVLRLMEQAGKDTKAISGIVRRAASNLDWIDQASGQGLYLVGGSWRALGQTHLRDTDYPLPMLHGYKQKTKDLLPWLKEVRDADDEALDKLPIKKKRRRSAMPAAAAALIGLIEASEAKEVTFSAYGIRQAMMVENLLSPKIWYEPQRLVQHAVLSMDHNGNRYDEDLRAALRAFLPTDLRQSPDLSDTAIELILELADVGWDYHPERRSQDVVFDVLHTQDLPLTHQDRVAIAVALNTRHGGDYDEEIDKDVLALLPKSSLKAALALGHCLRFALKFCGSSLPLLQAAKLVQKHGSLELIVKPDWQAAVTGDTRAWLKKLNDKL